MMKKLYVMASMLLTLSLILVSFTSVSAKPVPVSSTASAPDPTATGMTGDMLFTATVLEATALDGIQMADGMVYPAGFPTKEEQFIGKGLSIVDHAYGKANACFSFSASNQGWTANVYQWIDGKWVKLATTLNSGGEGTPTACAIFFGNGEFALIGGETNPGAQSLPYCINQKTFKPAKGMPYAELNEMTSSEGSYQVDSVSFYVFDSTHALEPNGLVMAWVDGITPPGAFIGTLSGSGRANGSGLTSILIIVKSLSPSTSTNTLHVIVDNRCQQIYHWGGGAG